MYTYSGLPPAPQKIKPFIHPAGRLSYREKKGNFFTNAPPGGNRCATSLGVAQGVLVFPIGNARGGWGSWLGLKKRWMGECPLFLSPCPGHDIPFHRFGNPSSFSERHSAK